MQKTSKLLVAGLLLVLVSCGRGDIDGQPTPEQPRVEVKIQNNNWNDGTLYISRGDGMWVSLGPVGTFSSRTWTVPQRMVNGNVRFRFDLLAVRQDYISPEIVADPRMGNISIQIENLLSTSAVYIGR